ncbi:hypothetical protein [Sporisorium scitamineum]|uniref:Uncharacterized protein n=1 Tax=Sporisorium scitamineum TaxID=49012 RepID=A0A0F7S0E5_9BASI|nr:hypothetical protein [Sporisorium scitamineum]
MLSIFTQTAQTSASEPQQSPADEGRKSDRFTNGSDRVDRRGLDRLV